MAGITRRTLLAFTGATAAIGPASAEGEGVSRILQALIVAHEEAYAHFHRVFRRPDSRRQDRERVDRIEQEALLAICAYSATSRADSRAKAEYLLALEARGELDREEHIQAILHSMLRLG